MDWLTCHTCISSDRYAVGSIKNGAVGDVRVGPSIHTLSPIHMFASRRRPADTAKKKNTCQEYASNEARTCDYRCPRSNGVNRDPQPGRLVMLSGQTMANDGDALGQTGTGQGCPGGQTHFFLGSDNSEGAPRSGSDNFSVLGSRPRSGMVGHAMLGFLFWNCRFASQTYLEVSVDLH